MSWLEAFRIQFLMYILACFFLYMRYLVNENFYDGFNYKKITFIVLTIMWLGIGTYFRQAYDWPMFGMYSRVYNYYI
jgi:hypothetical protein